MAAWRIGTRNVNSASMEGKPEEILLTFRTCIETSLEEGSEIVSDTARETVAYGYASKGRAELLAQLVPVEPVSASTPQCGMLCARLMSSASSLDCGTTLSRIAARAHARRRISISRVA